MSRGRGLHSTTQVMVCGLSELTGVSPRRLEKAKLWIDVTFASGYAIVRIFFNILISPLLPSWALKSREDFQIRTWGTRLNNVVDFIRLT